MKIAIIGAGLAGLGVVHGLLDLGVPGSQITVYDAAGVGAGASGAAAGIVHPYAGARARKNWRGDEAMAASQNLIERAEATAPGEVIRARGILRIALSERQTATFSSCAQEYPDVTSWNAAQCTKAAPGLVDAPGIFIERGMGIDIRRYLQVLWEMAHAKGCHLEIQAVAAVAELQDYDRIVVAAGMASVAIHECAQLPLHAVKGQLLELVWPKELPPLRYALNSVGYVLQHRPDRCLVGSTFEHAFKDEAPNLELAKAEILPKIAAFLPDLGRAEVVGCTAGLRASTPNHLPLAQKVGDKTWILTGLGSKGLLYHALLGSEIAAQLC